MKKHLAIIFLLFCIASISAQQDSIKPIESNVPIKMEKSSKNPEFPGGHQAFVKKILSNFRTPLLSKLNISSAKAIATFVVEKDGSMGSIKIESSENEIVKKEFLKALQSINTKWIPGEINGEKTSTRMRQPLVFIAE
jgi:hypothetical protein